MSKLLSRSQRLPAGGPGLIRVRGAGFLLRPAAPGEAGSYLRSTGVLALRPTDGEVEQVTCGVLVPVYDQAARLAQVRPLGQGQFGFHRTATRARPGTWAEPASRDQLAAVPGGLAGEHPPGFPEASVGDGAGEDGRRVNQDQPPSAARGNRQRAFPEPAVRGHRMNTLLPRPLLQVHSRIVLHTQEPAVDNPSARPFRSHSALAVAALNVIGHLQVGVFPAMGSTGRAGTRSTEVLCELRNRDATRRSSSPMEPTALTDLR